MKAETIELFIRFKQPKNKGKTLTKLGGNDVVFDVLGRPVYCQVRRWNSSGNLDSEDCLSIELGWVERSKKPHTDVCRSW